jgi:hypothetical protein
MSRNRVGATDFSGRVPLAYRRQCSPPMQVRTLDGNAGPNAKPANIENPGSKSPIADESGKEICLDEVMVG